MRVWGKYVQRLFGQTSVRKRIRRNTFHFKCDNYLGLDSLSESQAVVGMSGTATVLVRTNITTTTENYVTLHFENIFIFFWNKQFHALFVRFIYITIKRIMLDSKDINSNVDRALNVSDNFKFEGLTELEMFCQNRFQSKITVGRGRGNY